MDQTLRAFLFGVAGAASVEVLRVYKLYHRGRDFPARYHKIGFSFTVVLMVLVGGTLAVAHGATTDLLAFNLGVTGPLILEQVVRNEPPTSKPRPPNEEE